MHNRYYHYLEYYVLLAMNPSQRMLKDDARLSLLKSEAAICYDACKGAHLIIFNLFSLEGYFIALHLGIPCLAASPHLLTRYM